MCLSCLSGMLLRNVNVMLSLYYLYIWDVYILAELVDVTCDPAVQITNIPLKETNVFVLSFSPLDPITTVTPAQIFKLVMCA